MLFYMLINEIAFKRKNKPGVSGATAWNYLPLHVASAPSLAVFRQPLKTFPFSRSHQDYHMTHVLLLPFITNVWTPVVR